MMLLLVLAFNWLILFFTLDITISMFYTFTNKTILLLAVFTFIFVTGLAILFYSEIGQWLLRLFSGARKTILREDEKLNPIINQVQQAIKEKMNLKNLPIKLMVIDSPTPEAFAIGKNTLVISRGLYETASEDELAGVIAHEFSHFHHSDSNKLGMILGVSMVSFIVVWVASLFVTIMGFIGGFSSSEKNESDTGLGGILSIVGIFFAFFAFIFLFFVKIGNWVLDVAILFIGRKQEYKADQFAIKAGFGTGLLSFLEKLKDKNFDKPENLLMRFYVTHPPIMLRIGEIEKNFEVK